MAAEPHKANKPFAARLPPKNTRSATALRAVFRNRKPMFPVRLPDVRFIRMESAMHERSVFPSVTALNRNVQRRRPAQAFAAANRTAMCRIRFATDTALFVSNVQKNT